VQGHKAVVWTGSAFAAAGLACFFVFSWHDGASKPLAIEVALLVGLLCGVLTFLVLRLRDVNESSRKLGLIAAMNVQVNRDILLNEDLGLIYANILGYLFRIFNEATTGSILKLGDDGHLTFVASKGFSDEFVGKFRLRLEDSFLYQVTQGNFKEARLITASDFEDVATVIKPDDWRYQSVISAPIFVGDRLFGLLNLDSSIASTYDQKDLEIVERFRAQIEVVLLARERYSANIKRYQVDALSGLATRHYFEDQLAVALERAARYQERVVIGLFDVDGLKQVNDTQGHLAGDQLIAHIAQVLRKSARNSDIVGRLGGDEFVACYPMAKAPAIEHTIQEIRKQLRLTPILTGSGALLVPEFSFGLASFPEDGSTVEALLGIADQRMYAMKQAAH